MHLLARVVRCTPKDGGGYQLLLDFAGISEEDQEQLIQYIVRRQSQFLQQLREQRDVRPAGKPR
jgi:c-di-GMP-binding flagellar brake protein YcgR